MNRFHFSCLFLLIFTFSLSALGQTQPVPTPPPAIVDSDEVVKISTQLIQLDVVVTDKKGNQVTDLKPEDFEIYENGEKQEITNFTYISNNAAQPDSSNDSGKNSKQKYSVPPPSSKLKLENSKRTYAIVVDDLGLSFESMNYVRTVLKKFVAEQMQDGDLAAIMHTGSRGGMFQSFTFDKRQLLAAVEKLKWNPQSSGGINIFESINPTAKDEINGRVVSRGESGERQVKNVAGTQEDKDFGKQIDQFRYENLSAGTFGAINYIIRGMRDLPGRKSLMLFSEGFQLIDRSGIPAPSRTFEALRSLAELANRSSVVVYTLDPRGLQNPGMAFASDSIQNVFNDNSRVARNTTFIDSQQSLLYLADETGGFPFVNQNDLNVGMQRVLNDQKGYYLIGYQPDSDTFNPKKNKFNKIEVKLKPDNLDVRYHSGFYAIEEKEKDNKPQYKNADSPIYKAIASPIQKNEIDFRLTTLIGNDQKEGYYIRALFHVNGLDLTFTDEPNGMKKTVLDVVAVTLDEKGKVIEEFNRTYPIRIPERGLATVKRNGLDYSTDIPIEKPGNYSFRLAVRDEKTGRLSSLSDFVAIPDVKKDGFFINGLITTNITENGKPLMPKSRPPEAAFGLVFSNTISSIRQYEAGVPFAYIYDIYNAKLDKTTKKPKLTTKFRLFKDGKMLLESEEKSVELEAQNDFSRIQDYGFLRLNESATAGEYFLQLIIKDEIADKTSSKWIDFEIVE